MAFRWFVARNARSLVDIAESCPHFSLLMGRYCKVSSEVFIFNVFHIEVIKLIVGILVQDLNIWRSSQILEWQFWRWIIPCFHLHLPLKIFLFLAFLGDILLVDFADELLFFSVLLGPAWRVLSLCLLWPLSGRPSSAIDIRASISFGHALPGRPFDWFSTAHGRQVRIFAFVDIEIHVDFILAYLDLLIFLMLKNFLVGRFLDDDVSDLRWILTVFVVIQYVPPAGEGRCKWWCQLLTIPILSAPVVEGWLVLWLQRECRRIAAFSHWLISVVQRQLWLSVVGIHITR